MFMHDVSQVVEANGSKPTTYHHSEHSCGKVIWLFINRNLTLDLGRSAISAAQAAHLHWAGAVFGCCGGTVIRKLIRYVPYASTA
jgi:hypothetical protein